MKKNKLITIIIFLSLVFIPENILAESKCASGYTQVGKMCQKITNAYFRNGSYYCPQGSGTLDTTNKKCVSTYVLEDENTSNNNSNSNNDNSTSLSCDSGYISDGKKCYKVIGQAYYRDGSYYCDPKTYPGAIVIGTACVEESVKDVIDNNKNEQSNNDNNPSNDDEDKIKDQYIGNITCGGLTNFTFHKRVPKLTSTLYNLLKVAIPVILVIKGMMDMFKAMSAGKEDEMKKAQKKFINRLIAAVCAFIVFILVETVIGWISARTDNANAMKCVDCFINNKCDNN